MNEVAATETTNGNSNETVGIKTENVEYRVYATLKEDGSIAKRELVSNSDFPKWEKEHPQAQLELTQSVRKYKAGTIEAFVQLIGDDEEALNIANRGLSAKFSQKINTTLLETDEQNHLVFEPVEGVYDSLELLQQETVRKSLSPVEKAERDLKKLGFDPALVASLMQQIQQASAQAGS